MMARADADFYEAISRSSRRTAKLGAIVLIIFLVAFGAWAGTALLSGAIVAGGYFVATGENKIVQHPDGGVIREIKVREGDKVEAGQVLMVLEETAPKAELRRLILREARLEAMRVRLQAEAERKTELVWPETFQKYIADPELGPMLEAQMSTFRARLNNIQSDVASQQESINALMQRVEAGKIQIANTERQAALFTEEIDSKSQLVNSGLIRRSELLTLQRAHAGSSGEIGRLLGEVGDARDRIARAREQINGVYSAAVKTAMEQLHETLGDLQDVRERIRSAKAVLERIQIVAPVNGVVVKMRYHTPGGVVEPGRSILDLLPVDENLLIEVKVRPQDIDHVQLEQPANIRFNFMNARSTPMVTGTVVYISADAVPERAGFNASLDGTAKEVYLARVRIDHGETAKIPGFRAIAGMPVEVFIRTGDRTFFEYLTKPIKDSFARAFREL
ncbi:HlyD family type I secretion periplasmic adaptor subunit [Reyranella soli]|uniref:Membrane fusion protein (MFP) family protein n=1 Tax=Reyranella soli TaxID=1230389 RepID=A0A512N706_9HYPH|nr:HlyD family type I secretion periplasmic adaptor subunit [Reyranella soli]GEP54693.1 HlyD family type I secretion periplasmic adaptor subunit [Reyranella soli]